MSLRTGHWLRAPRSVSPETSSTSQSPRATALITDARPVRCETSPVNSPFPWIVTVFGVSPE